MLETASRGNQDFAILGEQELGGIKNCIATWPGKATLIFQLCEAIAECVKTQHADALGAIS